jgi:AraC-like DNA-binding protein
MASLLSFGHWKSSKTGKPLPPHTNAGLELVYVASGAVRWDYDGREVHVPAHHLSFTWPWQIHGARDTRLPSVELGRQVEQPWTLDGMAYACGLGRTAFATKTKELYADSPMRKLVRVRTESAAALLRETRLSVTEIAIRCGFTSSQHFATVFKDYRGHPPSAERNLG